MRRIKLYRLIALAMTINMLGTSISVSAFENDTEEIIDEEVIEIEDTESEYFEDSIEDDDVESDAALDEEDEESLNLFGSESYPEESEEESFSSSDLIPTFKSDRIRVDDGSDSDELLSDYIDHLAFGEEDEGPSSSFFSLNPANTMIYDFLKEDIEKVAAGELASTSFKSGIIDITELYDGKDGFTKEELGVDSLNSGMAVSNLLKLLGFDYTAPVNNLMVDLPYDLYWFDKTAGYSFGLTNDMRVVDNKLRVQRLKLEYNFYVTADYSISGSRGTLVADTEKTGAAKNAVVNAKAAVAAAISSGCNTDYKKVKYYKDYICDNVTYDYDALDSSVLYGNPWQVIHVFDGDPGTKVVCEGYAKAFKFLCDLSDFASEEVECYLMTGNLTSSMGSGGAHMWNVIRMDDGDCYLVDVTSCDSVYDNYHIEDNRAFLVGHSDYNGSSVSGYKVARRGLQISGTSFVTGDTLYYTYDSDSMELFSDSQRAISRDNYDPDSVDPTALHAVSIDQEDQTILVGETLQLTFTKTPAEAVTGSPVWSISNNTIASIDETGLLTGLKAGSTTINLELDDKVAQTSITVEEEPHNQCGENLTFEINNSTLIISGTGDMWNYDAQNPAPWSESTTFSKVTIGSGVTSIGNNAFSGCTKVTDITIPASVSKIGANIINGASSLTSIEIPQGVSVVDTNALTGADALVKVVNNSAASVSLPTPAVGHWTKDITEGREKITSISSGTAVTHNEYYIWFYRNGETGDTVCGKKAFSVGTKYAIPNSEFTRQELNFKCWNTKADGTGTDYKYGDIIKNLVDDGEVLKLYAQWTDIVAEGSCGTDIDWTLYTTGKVVISGKGSMYPSYGIYGVSGNEKVKTVVIEDGVITIGNGAFEGCVNLSRITIPESVSSIGTYAFSNCTSLTEITIPDGVQTIGNWAFENCTKLSEVKFGEGLQVVYNGAFSGCTSLRGVELPDPVYHIGAETFMDCTSLTEITIPFNVSSLESEVFSGCTNLKTVRIPYAVKTIVDDAFASCKSLADVYYDSAKLMWDKVSVGNNNEYLKNANMHFTDYIDKGTWNDNISWCLNENGTLAIVGTCDILEGDFPWWKYKQYITRIELSEGIKAIGASAFSSYESLTSIVIPISVANINSNAFSATNNITSVEYAGTRQQWNKLVSDVPELKAHSPFEAMYALFDANGGTVSASSKRIELDETYGELPVPVKTGYDFTGWYLSKTGNDKVTETTVVTGTENRTLYAHWENSDVNIYFTANGGYNATAQKTVKYDKPYGDLPTPVRTGYDFTGWFTKEEGGEQITKDSICQVTVAQALYAHWRQTDYYVTFVVSDNDVMKEKLTVHLMEEYGKLPTPDDRSGYIFAGWFTGKEEGVKVTEDTIVTNAGDHTLYAVWVNRQYVVSFDGNGGVASTISKTVIFGTGYGDLPVAEKENATFAGWYTEKEGGELITANTVVSVAKDHTLYARWTVVETPDPIDTPEIGDTPEPGDTPEIGDTPEPGDTPESGDEPDTDPEVPEGLWATGADESYVYTGSKITPEIMVYFGNTLLKQGSEYTVAYKNNVNVGTATVTITGKGDYAGKCIRTFEIEPVWIEDTDVSEIADGVVNGGKAVKPTVVVISGGQTLKENKDYKLIYDPISSAGSTDVTVKGIGNYTGEVYRTFTLRDKGTPSLKSAALSGLKKSYSLDEIALLDLDSLTVTVNKKAVDSTDYVLSLENCGRVGKGTILIQASGNGNYVGEKRVTVTITGTKLGSMSISRPSFTYNREALELEDLDVKVFTGAKGTGTELNYDEGDYNLSISASPVNVGTYTVTATGNAEAGYSGKLSTKFKITALPITNGEVSVTLPDEISFAQGGATPSPKVTYKSWTLREGTDYTISYANNKAAGSSATFTITGKGNFSGKRAPQTFTISPRDLATLSVACADIAANPKKKGTYYYSKPVIYDSNGKVLKENKDYTVTYTRLDTNTLIGKADVLPAGTVVRAEITAKSSNYKGTASVTYGISEEVKSLAKVKVGKIDSQAYTGKAVKLGYDTLPITFTSGSGKNKQTATLHENTDYVITDYYNNVKKGTASIRIEGKGAYTGYKIITFKIVASSSNISWVATK